MIEESFGEEIECLTNCEFMNCHEHKHFKNTNCECIEYIVEDEINEEFIIKVIFFVRGKDKKISQILDINYVIISFEQAFNGYLASDKYGREFSPTLGIMLALKLIKENRWKTPVGMLDE